MRDVFIDTEATTRFTEAMDDVLAGPSNYAGFVFAKGQAGRGKTEGAKHYHVNSSKSLYLRVRGGYTQTAFLQALLFEVKGKNGDRPRHSANRCKDMIIDLLEDDRKAIIIDEADKLTIGRIEDLRDILDETGVPVALVGEEGLESLLAERRRIWSRVVHEVIFGPVNDAEIAMYGMKAAGLNVPPTLCKKIASKTEGDFRLVRNIMILLEKAAKAADTNFIVDDPMLKAVLEERSWRRK